MRLENNVRCLQFRSKQCILVVCKLEWTKVSDAYRTYHLIELYSA